MRGHTCLHFFSKISFFNRQHYLKSIHTPPFISRRREGKRGRERGGGETGAKTEKVLFSFHLKAEHLTAMLSARGRHSRAIQFKHFSGFVFVVTTLGLLYNVFLREQEPSRCLFWFLLSWTSFLIYFATPKKKFL